MAAETPHCGNVHVEALEQRRLLSAAAAASAAPVAAIGAFAQGYGTIRTTIEMPALPRPD